MKRNQGADDTDDSVMFPVLLLLPNIAELVAPERLRPLRRVEFARMVDEGFFQAERVELLAGVIVVMNPQGARHAATIQRLTDCFAATLSPRASLRVQLPFAASDVSMPEPDLALVPPGDYDQAHPAQAFLIVEVAESSANKDRQVKTNVYAAAAVPEYWLVDLAAGAIEVRSGPVNGKYALGRVVRAGDAIRLQAFPDVEIAVGDVVR
jgi:Uma2 family endonuclease